MGEAREIPGRIARIRSSLEPGEWTRIGVMCAVVVGLFVAGFGLLLASPHYRLSRNDVFGLGTGLLALTLGMRHAFDADHISAIDNTTRKLMADGQRPISVGFFFSLGHSTVVLVMAIILNFGVRTLTSQVRQGGSALHGVTNIVGTSISGAFLYLIAALNVLVLVSIVKTFVDLRHGRFDEEELERQLAQRGLMNRFFGPLARRIDKPWKIYPIGVLFGLGFDTITEIALLFVAGTAAADRLPIWSVLSLPFLFAAGMSLFDTIDGCFMNFAYGWAFSRPVRKVYYNVVITALSVAVALLIGTVELFGLLATEFDLHGAFWHAMSGFDINKAGYYIVGLFVVTWAVALCVWHVGKIETKWETHAAESRARVLAADAAD